MKRPKPNSWIVLKFPDCPQIQTSNLSIESVDDKYVDVDVDVDINVDMDVNVPVNINVDDKSDIDVSTQEAMSAIKSTSMFTSISILEI